MTDTILFVGRYEKVNVRDHPLPFFRILAGSKPSENYLSRAFQACFTQSPTFANCVLSLLWKSCRIAGKVPDASDWVCDYQPATPHGGSIRPDLCLRPFLGPNQESPHKPIFIESKLGAILGEQQLKNYIKSGTEILVAATKNWPEVSKKKLSALGVNHLRWQDVSRALSTVSNRNAKGKFLCDAFLNYLEYSNMSYREDITFTHMEEVRGLLARVGSPKFLAFVPGSSFELANSCLALLRDARRIAQESMPKLTECGNWGPGYYHEQNDDNPAQIEWHVFGFEIFRKGQYSKSRLLCGLYFSAYKPNSIIWLVGHYGHNARAGREIWTPAQRFTSRKKLDANRLAQSILGAVGKWKPF